MGSDSARTWALANGLAFTWDNVPARDAFTVAKWAEAGTVLLGNTLVDVLAAALASSLAIQLVGDIGVAYATAIVTVLIVIFAAVLPKTYALAFPDRVALSVAPVMRGIT